MEWYFDGKIQSRWYFNKQIPHHVGKIHPFYKTSISTPDRDTHFWEIPINKITENWSEFSFSDIYCDDEKEEEKKFGVLRYRMKNHIVEVEMYPFNMTIENNFGQFGFTYHYSILWIMTNDEFKQNKMNDLSNMYKYVTPKIVTHHHERKIEDKISHIIIGAYISDGMDRLDQEEFLSEIKKSEKILVDNKILNDGDLVKEAEEKLDNLDSLINVASHVTKDYADTYKKNNAAKFFNRAYDAIYDDETNHKHLQLSIDPSLY